MLYESIEHSLSQLQNITACCCCLAFNFNGCWLCWMPSPLDSRPFRIQARIHEFCSRVINYTQLSKCDRQTFIRSNNNEFVITKLNIYWQLNWLLNWNWWNWSNMYKSQCTVNNTLCVLCSVQWSINHAFDWYFANCTDENGMYWISCMHYHRTLAKDKTQKEPHHMDRIPHQTARNHLVTHTSELNSRAASYTAYHTVCMFIYFYEK